MNKAVDSICPNFIPIVSLEIRSIMSYLDPQNAAFAQAIDGAPEPHELGYVGAFESLEGLQKWDVAQDIVIETIEVPGLDEATTVVISRPKSAPSNLPMVFYLHGGGWIMGR